MVGAGLLLDGFAAFYESGAHGAGTLPELTGLPYGAVVAAVVVLALAVFAGAEWFERRVR